MSRIKGRNAVLLVSSALALFGVTGFSSRAQCGDEQQGMREINAINLEWQQLILKASAEKRIARSATEKARIQADTANRQRELVDRCVAVAARQNNDRAGLIALKMVACASPQTAEGKNAAQTLIKKASSAPLDNLATALSYPVLVSEEPIRPLMPILLDRVKKEPADKAVPRLLTGVVCDSEDRTASKPSPQFIEAADLIVQRYADSPDIVGFCEGMNGCRWAGQFEKHLKTILEKNQNRGVRCAATFTLACIAQEAGESRRAEAEKRYEDFIKTYDGSVKYYYAPIEQADNKQAEYELTVLGLLGKPAQETQGVDLDGRVMKLSDFRGKVVLLSFWASWCRPCLQMVPHERDMLKRFENKGFVVVGVNNDDDLRAGSAAAAEHQVTWRSFQDVGRPRRIAEEWHVQGWPTFYLIDRDGIVRRRWVSDQPEEIASAIDQLMSSTPSP